MSDKINLSFEYRKYILLIPLLFLIIGIFVLINSISNLIYCYNSRSWKSCESKLLNISIKGGSSDEGYYLNLDYEFVVNNKLYNGNSLYSTGNIKETYSFNEANSIKDTYKIGKSLKIYYNPKNPEESSAYINEGFSNIYLEMIASVLFIIFPLIIFYNLKYLIKKTYVYYLLKFRKKARIKNGKTYESLVK